MPGAYLTNEQFRVNARSRFGVVSNNKASTSQTSLAEKVALTYVRAELDSDPYRAEFRFPSFAIRVATWLSARPLLGLSSQQPRGDKVLAG